MMTEEEVKTKVLAALNLAQSYLIECKGVYYDQIDYIYEQISRNGLQLEEYEDTSRDGVGWFGNSADDGIY